MNAQNPKSGMSLVVKTVSHLLKAFILLFGINIVLYGHITPGGGFAGGVIVACAFVLITLAEGQPVGLKTLSKGVASEMDSVGAILFLGSAVTGLLMAGTFFKNYIETPEASWFHLLSSGSILIANVAIGIKVSMALFLAFTMLAALHVTVKAGGRTIMRRGKE